MADKTWEEVKNDERWAAVNFALSFFDILNMARAYKLLVKYKSLNFIAQERLAGLGKDWVKVLEQVELRQMDDIASLLDDIGRNDAVKRVILQRPEYINAYILLHDAGYRDARVLIDTNTLKKANDLLALKNKKIGSMNYQELVDGLAKSRSGNNKDSALHYLERLYNIEVQAGSFIDQVNNQRKLMAGKLDDPIHWPIFNDPKNRYRPITGCHKVFLSEK